MKVASLVPSVAVIAALFVSSSTSTHHRIHARFPQPVERHAPLVPRDDRKPLIVTNNCGEDIYPGIVTQHGSGPVSSGFKLSAGHSNQQDVSGDWQGRVWGRTNCSFNADGTGPSNNGGNNGGGASCLTGDCNGLLQCVIPGATPVTLAEFTLDSNSKQTFYDISLVDGYNLPMAIVFIPGGDQSLDDVPPNLTNPVCIGTAAQLLPDGWNPYASGSSTVLGTNATYPLQIERDVTLEFLMRWCPWDLQLSPPTKPGDGVYPYPDDNIVRPSFDPCHSACAFYNRPSDCCTGAFNDPKKCKPGLYSTNAKTICPDGYSYAYDDQTSTFIIPAGGGFEVVFCPQGRSTNILTTMSTQLHELAQTGKVSTRDVAPGGKPKPKRADMKSEATTPPRRLGRNSTFWGLVLVCAFLV